jgi:hypothetical protein
MLLFCVKKNNFENFNTKSVLKKFSQKNQHAFCAKKNTLKKLTQHKNSNTSIKKAAISRF